MRIRSQSTLSLHLDIQKKIADVAKFSSNIGIFPRSGNIKIIRDLLPGEYFPDLEIFRLYRDLLPGEYFSDLEIFRLYRDLLSRGIFPRS